MNLKLSGPGGPHLTSKDAATTETGVALMLHGGQVASRERVNRHQLAVLRIAILANAVHAQVARDGIAVWNLRFAVRGWNGTHESPVADVSWALEQIRQHSGRPVVIVGHSMGARAALRVAGEKSVRGVVALAPWLPPNEPMAALTHRRLVILHGNQDKITDPAASARYAQRARSIADSAQFHEVPGGTHSMLRHAGTWNRLTVEGVREVLGGGELR